MRPSWALFVPAMLAAWVVAGRRVGQGRSASARRGPLRDGRRRGHGPWWVRNARVYGRFVPTALWMGASLYDGLNPRATGASDMIPFLRDPEIWPLDEQDQDAELTRRAIAFAREQPGRVLGLAVVKLGRYWSPWPNAAGFRSWAVAVASAVVELPILGADGAGPLGPPPRSPRLGPPRGADPLLLRPAHGLRQLDALPHPRRDARAGTGGDRMRFRVGEAPSGGRSDETGLGGTARPSGFPREGGPETMRIGRRVAKVLFWGVVLCLSILGGGLWFAYTYVTDSETAARWIKQYAVRVPAGLGARPGPGPRASAHRRADAQQHQGLSADRRVAVPDAARPLAARPGRTPGSCSAASWTSARWTSSSRPCGSVSARTARGTSRACSPTHGPAPGWTRRRRS